MSPTWLITGTSSGLGRIMTERLLDRGDRVAATVRRPEALADLAARHGERLRVATLDVTDTNAVRGTIDRAFGELGRIDCVVSNAGYGVLGAAEENTTAMLRQVIDTNLIGAIELIRAAIPHLRAQGGGHVLQVSSEGGQTTYPGFSFYHAIKWGIEGFVESVAQEVEPFGIGFTLVEPGPTPTGFAAAIVQPARLPVYAGTAVDDVRRAIASGAFRLTGDAGRCVDAMIGLVDRGERPLRLTLGSTAYDNIHAALTRRLAALKAGEAVARAADAGA